MSDPTTRGASTHAPGTPRPRLVPTRGRRRLGALLTAMALGAGTIAAAPPARAASPGFCADGTQPYVPVSEARGWTGGESVTGLTVAKGTTPEGFTGTYIGFIADALGKGRDLLLFRLSNPTIDGTNGLKPAGVWAGMSGSPVYSSDGRLIGAVSYSLNGDNLPIAGVTPAEYMKSIGSTGVESAARVRLTTANVKTTAAGDRVAGLSLPQRSLTQIKTVNVAGRAGVRQNALANRTLARTPRTAAAADLLRSNSFKPATAGTSSAISKNLVPGGNIVITFASGDLDVGAAGTVTAICGNTVWALGHPLLQLGKTSMLMSNASVATVVPDSTGVDSSFKQVSEIGEPIGMITQDRMAGVRGTVGAISAYPMTVKVQNPAGKQIAAYATQIPDQEVGAPAAALLTAQAAVDQLDQVGAGTGKITWTINYRRANGATGKFTNSQVVSDLYYFPDEIGTPAADDIWTIFDQRYENVSVTGVSITLKLLSADAVAYEVGKVQRLNKSKWTNLSGSTLKPGTGYSLRNVYRKTVNGRPAGSVNGPAFSVKLSSSARVKGSLKVSGLGSDGSCDDLGECAEWGNAAADSSNEFDILIGLLDAKPSNDRVRGKLAYKLKKGTSTRNFSWTGPGLTTGSTAATFAIAKKK